MKKFKVAYILWAIMLVIIVGLLTYLGYTYQNKMKPYKDLESTLINNVSKYIEKEFLYPNEGETLKVTLNDLKNSNIIEDLKFENDSCDGYVLVTLKTVYEYDAYIKCANYETKGY